MADGSLAQVHVTLGVDGLAPPGTLTPIEDISVATAESTDPSAVARVGIVLNWAPTMNLFVADPRLNRLVVVDLADDGTLFSVAATHEITAEEFDVPIDIAPAVREVASVNFASNTTLGGGSDLYVLNRGSNSIVRMDLAGNVLDVRDIEVDVADYRVNGIGVSSDNQTLYVTATLPNARGMLLAMPAFGAHPMTERLLERIGTPPGADFADVGAALFSHEVTADEGLGPLFNAPSCAGCHSSPFVGGMGLTAETSIRVVGRVDGEGEFDSLLGRGGPFARSNAVIDHRDRCGWPGVPRRANAISVRSAMTLRGMGLLDAIRVRDVLANQASEPEAVRGRPHLLPDGRLGKFGWKANVASVVEFMGEAYRNEIGLTNPLTPDDFPGRGCRARGDEPGERVNDDPAVDVDALPLTALASFLNTLDPPVPSEACATSEGAQLFASVGCAGCHAPSLPGRSGTVSLYSDLLLHDMGPALADDVIQGDASGSEWRTMPLWRTVERERFLHDGRAATVEEAILLHGGQAQSVRDAFDALASDERNAVLEFLSCI
jgi:mono/diheme cytochrome c family protein